jgi:alpha-glucosidase
MILHGFDQNIQSMQVNNMSTDLRSVSIKLLDGLEYLEDFYDKNYFQSLRASEPVLHQLTFVMDNIKNEIAIKW